jgi:hypothetical protein
MGLFLYPVMQNYILVPHFYRLNWAREMSEFLKNSGRFEFLGKDFQYGNYSKAGKLRDEYLNDLIENKEIKDRALFFVNLNDYIYYERREELREKFDIVGFMRGSRFFSGEPGNSSFGKNGLAEEQETESAALIEVDKIFLGSTAFKKFLTSKIDGLDKKDVRVVGIPIFQKPYWMEKTEEEVEEFKNNKVKGSILWNHRLQKQKNPWVLFQLEDFIKTRLSICTPEALSAAYSKEMKQHESVFRKIIRDNGKKRSFYLNELKCAEFVLSTSEHETWGNSIIEGIMNDAVPIAPDGEMCSYRELLPKEFLYPQNLVKREKDIFTNEDNMIQLSYFIDDFININHSNQLKKLQTNLWNKYNKDEWIKRLF